LREDGLTGGEWMLRRNVMVEVSWDTAQRWGMVGRLGGIERLFGMEDLR
jgi:hypothetical protein